jgi:hypothetical protein
MAHIEKFDCCDYSIFQNTGFDFEKMYFVRENVGLLVVVEFRPNSLKTFHHGEWGIVS